jgi:hypothetical protein
MSLADPALLLRLRQDNPASRTRYGKLVANKSGQHEGFGIEGLEPLRWHQVSKLPSVKISNRDGLLGQGRDRLQILNLFGKLLIQVAAFFHECVGYFNSWWLLGISFKLHL